LRVRLVSLAVVAVAATVVSSRANPINFFDSRASWIAAVGKYWDVDLNDGVHNSFTPGSTYIAGSPINLPPGFHHSLSFDANMDVVNGNGWNNYITGTKPGDLGYTPPVVFSVSLAAGNPLNGSFTEMVENFGFEVQATLGTTFTINVNGASQTYTIATTDPQFIGWTTPSYYGPDGEVYAANSFSLTSSANSYKIGNFVIPDAGTTFGLLSLSLTVLFLAQRRSLTA